MLPSTGERMAWSPDGKRVAFVSSAPGPEADANGDPMVITRYAYKPTASEGLTRFNDNRRVHIYVVDVATRAVRQLTSGTRYEHSINWSADGLSLFTVVRERGMARLYRLPLDGSRPELVVGDTGSVASWSVATTGATGALAYSFCSPTEPASLRLLGRDGASRQILALNGELLGLTPTSGSSSI